MRLYTADALLTSASAEVVHGGGVLIDGGQIVAAGRSEALRSMGPVAEVVDVGAVTLLPGLIDAHVHLGFDGSPAPVARMRAETDAEQLILMRSSARQLLQAGVTTARDLGARAFLDIAVRDAIACGTADGPRLITAGRPLTPAGLSRYASRLPRPGPVPRAGELSCPSWPECHRSVPPRSSGPGPRPHGRPSQHAELPVPGPGKPRGKRARPNAPEAAAGPRYCHPGRRR